MFTDHGFSDKLLKDVANLCKKDNQTISEEREILRESIQQTFPGISEFRVNKSIAMNENSFNRNYTLEVIGNISQAYSIQKKIQESNHFNSVELVSYKEDRYLINIH